MFLFACIAYAEILALAAGVTIVATDRWLQRRKAARFRAHLEEIRNR